MGKKYQDIKRGEDMIMSQNGHYIKVAERGNPLEVHGTELTGIESIAIAMNESTFERFCELWRKYHEQE